MNYDPYRRVPCYVLAVREEGSWGVSTGREYVPHFHPHTGLPMTYAEALRRVTAHQKATATRGETGVVITREEDSSGTLDCMRHWR